MDEIMGIIADAMESLGLRYDFEEWGGKVEYPYFVGHYDEVAPATEDGMQEASFLVTGWSRKSWLELQKAANAIREAFPTVSGRTGEAGGVAYGIWYETSTTVPTEEPELKSIQITLNVKYWRTSNG